METAINQELMAAQERLLAKRAEQKVTGNLTRLILKHDEEIEEKIGEAVEVCEHGTPRNEYCPACYEERVIRREREHEEQVRQILRSQMADPTQDLRNFGVPAKYVNCSFTSYLGQEKLVNECQKYQDGGLVLYGNTGSGKTHLAVATMRNRIIRQIETILDGENGSAKSRTIPRQCFVTVPDLLLSIRESFKDKSEVTEKDIIDKYSNIPFLVLDDLGSEKTSEFAITTLYIIIDRRDRELKSTVITTNLSPAEIEEKLSARIASRLSGMKNINMAKIEDYRKKR